MLLPYVLFSLLTVSSVFASAFRATGGKANQMTNFMFQSKLSRKDRLSLLFQLFFFFPPDSLGQVMVLANGALCLLLLFSKTILLVFLGPLRPPESAKLQDRLGSFVFFKLMFIAAMLEHSVGRADIWLLWLVACGLLKVKKKWVFFYFGANRIPKTFAFLGRERIEFLLGSGGYEHHKRPLMLVLVVFAIDLVVIGLSVWLCRTLSFALLLAFECVCIALDCMHALAKVSSLSSVKKS